MSEFNGGKKSSGPGCFKVAAIGCGSIVILGLLSSLSSIFYMSGLDYGASNVLVKLFQALPIVAIIVFFILRSRRKQDATKEQLLPADLTENPYASKPKSTIQSSAVTSSSYSAPPVAATESFGNPICHHQFSDQQMYATKTITCECGNTFRTADLLELKRLQANLAATEKSIDELSRLIRQNAKTATSAAQANNATSSAAAVKQGAPKPKLVRPKINLSLQQWLIIGASVLVLVAGSVFVSTNVNRLDQWVFELITVGVAAATGLGAFKARNISVLLANFLAAFSSSMQLATMAIIGDQISPNFEWNTMPAWWWLVSLTAVSAVATFLAKLSKNYGFKGIAVLSGAAALLVLSLGVIRPLVATEFAPVYLVYAGLAGAGLLAVARFIRSISSDIPKEKEAAAYAKDLAKREDTSLRVLAQILAALILLSSVGSMMTAIDPGQLTNFSWISLLATSLTWALLVRFSKFWIDQIQFEQVNEDVILKTSTGIAFVALFLATVFGALEIQNSMVAAALSLALLTGLTWLVPLQKSFSPNRVSVVVALWSSLAVWVFWSRIDLLDNDAWITGVYAMAFAAILSLTALRFNVNRYDWGASLVNGLGVLLITWNFVWNNAPDFDSLWVGLSSIALVLATSVQLPIRHFVNERQNYHAAPLSKWVAFFFSALVAFALFLQSTGNGQLERGVPLAFAGAMFALAIAAATLANRGPLVKSYSGYLSANHYLGQTVVALSVLASIVAHGSEFAGTNAVLIALLAIMNYTLGTLKHQALRMQLGFAASIGAFLVWQWSLGKQDFTAALLLQMAIFSAAIWLHTWFLRKRTTSGETTLIATALAGIGLSSILGWTILAQIAKEFESQQLLIVAIAFASAGLLSAALGKLSPLAAVKSRELALGWVAIEFTIFGLLSNLIHTADETLLGNYWRLLLSFAAFSASIWLKNFKVNQPALVVVYFASNLAGAFFAGQIFNLSLNYNDWPESQSVWISLALVVSALTTKEVLGGLQRILLVDAPVLFTAGSSLIYALMSVQVSDINTWREIISLAVIAAFAYWRSGNSAVAPWLAVGYLAGLGSALSLAHGIQNWLDIRFDGPEIYSVVATISFILGNTMLVKRLGKTFVESRLILIVATLTVPSFIYGITEAPDLLENQIRVLLSLTGIAALALLRISRSKPLPWVITSYLATLGAALAAARLLCDQLFVDFNGPEVYSVLAAAAIFAVHRVGLEHFKFESSLFKTGLPMATLVLPSIFYTWTSLDVPFAELDGLQLGRIVVSLVATLALFVHGSRSGNLATSTVGLGGIALLVVPNTAMHSEDVVVGSRVDSTALVLALLAFAVLALVRKYVKLSANSLLYIGLPVAIVLAPALVQSLLALGNPELTTVDWWRFGIILTAGMTLLIVGTLREVAGLFYPGLIAVLLSALPYGFKQTQQNQWSLWVLLLLVAAVMVWLAVRLENFKKAGRNSATWLKELK